MLSSLTLMNNAATNIGTQVSVRALALSSLRHIPGVEWLDHMVILCSTFGGGYWGT